MPFHLECGSGSGCGNGKLAWREQWPSIWSTPVDLDVVTESWHERNNALPSGVRQWIKEGGVNRVTVLGCGQRSELLSVLWRGWQDGHLACRKLWHLSKKVHFCNKCRKTFHKTYSLTQQQMTFIATAEYCRIEVVIKSTLLHKIDFLHSFCLFLWLHGSVVQRLGHLTRNPMVSSLIPTHCD